MFVLGACGGEEGSEDFAAEVERICLAEAAAFEDLSQAPPERPSDVADQIEEASSIRERALAELEELDPPDDARDVFADYLANREESLVIMRAAGRAAGRDDRETLQIATTTLSDLTRQRELVAAQLGADRCVGEEGEE